MMWVSEGTSHVIQLYCNLTQVNLGYQSVERDING